MDPYTKEVINYYLPTLNKGIIKTLDVVEQTRFLKLDANRSSILEDLASLEAKENELLE